MKIQIVITDDEFKTLRVIKESTIDGAIAELGAFERQLKKDNPYHVSPDDLPF